MKLVIKANSSVWFPIRPSSIKGSHKTIGAYLQAEKPDRQDKMWFPNVLIMCT